MITHGTFMRPVASSFPLQLTLNVSIWFVPCWWALTFSLLMYKGSMLPYPPLALGFESFITFVLWFIQYWAVQHSKRGNLTEQTSTLLVGLVLQLFAVGGLIFYMLGQTYVMRIDQGFSATLLVLDAISILLSIFAIQGFGAAAAAAMPPPPPPPLAGPNAGALGGGGAGDAMPLQQQQQQQQFHPQQQQQQFTTPVDQQQHQQQPSAAVVGGGMGLSAPPTPNPHQHQQQDGGGAEYNQQQEMMWMQQQQQQQMMMMQQQQHMMGGGGETGGHPKQD